MKRIAILGSTGSIGTQALEVIAAHPEHFEVELLTAHNNADLLIAQAIKFSPNAIVISNEGHYLKVKDALSNLPIKVFAGIDSVIQAVCSDTIDIVLTAQVGFSGLRPTIAAIHEGKTIALANKETLVVAGDYISSLCVKHKAKIIPVDSEHSAIFQCLSGEYNNAIEKIYLTASGGPFRGKTIEELANVTKTQALKHPNWSMGAKITIDSASLMNKALEIIEAKWLFGLEPEQIDVIVHPQSIIHSLVQFTDGSMKAQMGLPDMKLPIQYAFTYPDRISTTYPRFDFLNYSQLTFESADRKTFRSLEFAYYCLEKGGNMACILNAANEVANASFLEDKIKFLDIFEVVEATMEATQYIAKPGLNDYFETDSQAREIANKFILTI